MMSFSPAQLLVIDDDPGMCALVEGLVDRTQVEVHRAKTLAAGLEKAVQIRADLIILDHLLPDGAGIDRLEELIRQDRLRPVLYVTAHSGSKTAIEAIKRGAYDYLSKPIDFSLLQRRIAEAIEYRQLTRVPVVINRNSSNQMESEVLVGRCRAMQEVYKGIGRLASLSSPVLVEGEVGTGKELIARTIHLHGVHKDRALCKVSAEDFEEEQLADELFGDHTKRNLETDGPFANCGGGTLLIEEIGNVSLNAQAKILRYLKDQNADGSTRQIRVIATTSSTCRSLVERKMLRSDLYYFLSPYVIRVPPLRERTEDFEILVAHFMESLANVTAAHQSQLPPRISTTALEILKSYDWPGNVAQLKSVLQSVLMESRGAVLATDSLRRALDSRSHLPSLQIAPNENETDVVTEPSGYWNLASFVQEHIDSKSGQLYESAVKALDNSLLQLVLQHTRGNQAAAARILGITRTSLRRKIAASNIRVSHSAELRNSAFEPIDDPNSTIVDE